MPLKNLISPHETIAIALLNKPTHTDSFETIAKFIVDRNVCRNRECNVDLATQVMLRCTKLRALYSLI